MGQNWTSKVILSHFYHSLINLLFLICILNLHVCLFYVLVVSTHDAEKTDMFLSVLCAALAVSLIVTAFLVCAVWKTSCNCCKGKTNSLHVHKLLFPKS